MTKKYTLSFALIIFTFLHSSAQQLLSDSLLAHYSRAQADSIYTANGIPLSATCGMRFYRVVYQTLNARQQGNTIASGLVVVPDSISCPLAVASYDHGTVMERYNVPSFMGYEALLSMILATNGYFSIAPDYLGLGVSPGFHPYIHARSEAQATIDMIFASKTFAANHNIELTDQLFLTGYSQGGHACMATHRAIQQNYTGQLNVTASAPGSGPYNVSGIQAVGLAGNNYYADPSYLPYIAMSYQSVYGNLYDSVQQFLKSPWDTILPPLYNGLISTDSVDRIMPHHVDSFVVDSQLIWYNTDSANNPLRVGLRDNDVYAWVPIAPIKMTYCTADEQVVYQNSIFAYDYFRAHGDSSAEIANGGAVNHENCVTPFLYNVLGFFDHYRFSENTLSLTFSVDSESATGSHNASVKVSVSGGTGYTISWSNGSTDSVITGLSNGTYTVTVTSAAGCSKVRSVSTGGVVNGINDLTASAHMTISPNPANNTLNIKTSELNPDMVLIYDMSGQKVRESAYTEQIDISGLSQGIYMVEVKGKQETARGKFVKM